MNKLIINSIFAFTLVGTSIAIASHDSMDVENSVYPIIQLSELIQDKAEATEVCKDRVDDMVISIENAIISFNVTLISDILDGEKHTSRKVKITKPCFLKCEQGKHYFSADSIIWKSFKDFFHSNLAVVFDIDEDNLVNIDLNVKLNVKE